MLAINNLTFFYISDYLQFTSEKNQVIRQLGDLASIYLEV
ncbi:15214_t:CDS:2 [Racocetra fulgida]|uniref:15214_t:CDS:1 n=1 Tax=Racocetra fulgida TaxID=60492 RepID=A0A9N8VQ44_9GLOM|nr:15214_t:CDS:2 [Racocetra fulgida]